MYPERGTPCRNSLLTNSSNHATPTTADTVSQYPNPTATQADNTNPGALRSLAENVVIPIMALGLSTPVVSHTICFIGSKILEKKINKEADDIMIRNFDGANESGRELSKAEKKRYKAEMKAYLKRVKEEERKERELLKLEQKLARKYNKEPNDFEILSVGSTTDEEENWKTWTRPFGNQVHYTNRTCWLTRKKESLEQKLAEAKQEVKTKLKPYKKVGLVLGFGQWSNY
ncbi:hypothetical protein ABW19_dt0201418 [Dactylella cylindrospora]|nr:hypothetical protein ABW19_dt0201418 [Dactylella cylindrospora]